MKTSWKFHNKKSISRIVFKSNELDAVRVHLGNSTGMPSNMSTAYQAKN